MKRKILFAGIAALLVTAGTAQAMLQSDFVELCRLGTPSEVALALQTGKVSAAAPVQGVTPLMAAASSRGEAASADKIRQLLNSGARVNDTDRTGMTALMYAARLSARADVLRALIDAGADVNARDRRGWTALSHAAAKNYNPGAVMELIDAGADVNVPDRQNVTPLMLAFRGGVGRSTVLALLDSGADASLKDRSGRTAADYFARSPLKNDAELAQALKETPAIRPVEPARFAAVCRFGTLQRLKSLIEAGTDPMITVDGLTPLMWAARDNSDASVLKVLLRAGLDVNARDPEGRTALMYAAQNSGSMLKTMIEAGARIDDEDSKGRTAYDYARESGKIPENELLPLKNSAEALNRVRAEGEKQLQAEKSARAADAAKAAETEKALQAKIDELTAEFNAEKQGRAADAAKAAETGKTLQAKIDGLTAELDAEKQGRAADAAKAAGEVKALQDRAAELEKQLAAAETKKEN